MTTATKYSSYASSIHRPHHHNLFIHGDLLRRTYFRPPPSTSVDILFPLCCFCAIKLLVGDLSQVEIEPSLPIHIQSILFVSASSLVHRIFTLSSSSITLFHHALCVSIFVLNPPPCLWSHFVCFVPTCIALAPVSFYSTSIAYPTTHV